MESKPDLPAIAPRTAGELLAIMEKSQSFRRAYVLACMALDKAAQDETTKIFREFAAEERVDVAPLTWVQVAQALTKYCLENPVNCRYFMMKG